MTSPVIFAGVLFLFLAGAFWLLGYRYYVRPGQMRARLGEPVMAGPGAIHDPGVPLAERMNAMFQRFGKMMPLGRNASVIQQLLSRAGYRTEAAPQIFLGLRAVCVVVLFLLALVVPIGDSSNPAVRMVFMVGGAGIGWRIPLFMLKKRVTARQERLRLALPDALDLIIIAVEAGLGIDQAISHVANELTEGDYSELSEEMKLIGMEMRAGMRRGDALRSFAERTGEEEVQKLTAILIQNDKFGTGMGEALRSHSQYLRVARRLQADERASKVGVKLVFPIFFFILPSMMLVAAGPGLLQIFKYLFPMMKQIH